MMAILAFKAEHYEEIYERVKVNVIAASYRGYRFSEDKPTEMGLYLDLEAIVQHSLCCGLSSRSSYMFGHPSEVLSLFMLFKNSKKYCF